MVFGRTTYQGATSTRIMQKKAVVRRNVMMHSLRKPPKKNSLGRGKENWQRPIQGSNKSNLVRESDFPSGKLTKQVQHSGVYRQPESVPQSAAGPQQVKPPMLLFTGGLTKREGRYIDKQEALVSGKMPYISITKKLGRSKPTLLFSTYTPLPGSPVSGVFNWKERFFQYQDYFKFSAPFTPSAAA